MSDKRLAARGAISTDELLVRFFGRDFGTVMEDAARFQQPVPDFFQPIVSDLRAASAILKLTLPTTEDVIFDAYKHDVIFLQERLDQLQSWVKICIEASVKPNDSYDRDDDRVKRGWEFVQQHIPLIAHAPLIDLPAERAALPADQLLAELKQEVDAGIESVMKRFSLWLDLLVAKEYVGIVHFSGPTVGHYYYFRPYTTEKVAVTDRRETTIDPSVPFGQQTTYTEIEGRHYKITEAVERHDHHIVKAKVDTLGDYTGVIPNRIIRALDAAPEWLRPHLRVVSGDITKEVVRQRVVREHEEVHERITSTFKGSPAIALGSYALNGWSSDDTRSEPSDFFRGQKVYSFAKRADVRRFAKRLAVMIAVLGSFAGGIWYAMYSWSVGAQASYDQFYSQVAAGKTIYTMTKEKGVTLPRGEPLFFIGQANSGTAYWVSTDTKTVWRPFKDLAPRVGNQYKVVAKEAAPHTYYGTFDLGPDTGIPARMHVVYADSDKMQFVIEYYRGLDQ